MWIPLTFPSASYLGPSATRAACDHPEALTHFIIRMWEPVDYTRVPGSAEGFEETSGPRLRPGRSGVHRWFILRGLFTQYVNDRPGRR